MRDWIALAGGGGGGDSYMLQSYVAFLIKLFTEGFIQLCKRREAFGKYYSSKSLSSFCNFLFFPKSDVIKH